MTTSPQLAQLFADNHVFGAVHAVSLSDGSDVGVHPDEPVFLASVFKTVVLVALVRAFDDGVVDPAGRVTIGSRYRLGGVGTSGCVHDVEISWRDAAAFMMSMSDNAATDSIFHHLGQPAVQKVIDDLGLTDTRIVGCCEDIFEDIGRQVGERDLVKVFEMLADMPPERILSLRVLDPLQSPVAGTPRDVTKLLTSIWGDEAAAPAACAEARQLMSNQVWTQRMASGFDADVHIASKTGTLGNARNEAGVVTYPDGTQYAVAVFTRSDFVTKRQPMVDQLIGEAAHLAVELLRHP